MESNIAQIEKVIEKEEDRGRCLAADSRAIDGLAFINLERDWIEYNKIHYVEKEDTDKKQEEAKDVQTRHVVAAIDEIKEADPKILNVKDIEIDPKHTVSKNQYTSNEFIGESIEGDVVEVLVSD
ncbi:hypothetical protein FXO38_12926 [Capsicum annuum]|nr:hypothetical protein FXO37_14633 [Capsicum annuum]KAF3658918.1 hypothetical protein FXO38_12926 [Capsicum annuum]